MGVCEDRVVGFGFVIGHSSWCVPWTVFASGCLAFGCLAFWMFCLSDVLRKEEGWEREGDRGFSGVKLGLGWNV